MSGSINRRIDKQVHFTLIISVVIGAMLGCGIPQGMPGIVDQNSPTITPMIGSPSIPPDSGSNLGQDLQSTAAPAPTYTPSPTQEVHSLWIAPYVPSNLTNGLVAPFGLSLSPDPERSDLKLDVGDQNVITRIVYALTAPFPSLVDEVSFEELFQSWTFAPQGRFSSTNLFVSEATFVLFTRWWGAPAGDFVQVTPEDKLLDRTWQAGSAWALIPFDMLEPRWKVIAVDGDNPIWKSFDPTYYRLSVPISISGGDPEKTARLAQAFELSVPVVYNRDPNKLTTVVLTGVTALVRATAAEMEMKGIEHPASELGGMLREADILHISNEIPFSPTCPAPKWSQPNLVFCSSPDYNLLLEAIGTDVVELSGDHFGDWGTAAVLYTLDLYDQVGFRYYGGGETVAEAQAPLLIEHNGNKIAFVGCNAKGGSYTPLVNGWPGAVDCRFDEINPLLNQLEMDGYVTIMTFQHHEFYYFDPNFVLENDFRMVADAGADIVSGSQAHQPHGMEFYHGSTLFYGLGNMFFDQLNISEDTSRALITRNVIYDNRHISSEIITIYFADYSQPLYLLDDGRDRLLQQVFDASEWGDLVFGN